MENPIKVDDSGGKPTIFGNTHVVFSSFMGNNSLDRKNHGP